MGEKREKKEKKKQRKWIFGVVALGVFSLCGVLAILGLGRSVEGIREAEVAQSPTVLLANAGAKEDKVITLPVTYYDQASDECGDMYTKGREESTVRRQWEWRSCKYYTRQIEEGLAEPDLGWEGLPIARGGGMVSNRDVDFNGWFSEVEGVSERATGTLSMHYQKDGAIFSFAADDFYPVDGVDFSDGDPVNEDGHNHLFTMNFTVPFTALASGEEVFSIQADDDTFVFLDGRLVIDMGGIHDATLGEMTIDKDGKVYSRVEDGEWKSTGVSVLPGAESRIAVFHADRDSGESVFELEFSGMSLGLSDGVQIAAVSGTETDGEPGFTAPLGETKVFEPDTARMLTLVATIEGVMIVVAAVLVVAVARFMIKQKMNSD